MSSSRDETVCWESLTRNNEVTPAALHKLLLYLFVDFYEGDMVFSLKTSRNIIAATNPENG
jgi:hypothetical protein